MPVPKGFDYDDFWLARVPGPYHADRCLYKFRFILDYSGGQTTNFGATRSELPSGRWVRTTPCPVEFEDLGAEFPPKGVLFNTPPKWRVRRAIRRQWRRAGLQDRSLQLRARFEGSDGMAVRVGSRAASMRTVPASRRSVIGPQEQNTYCASSKTISAISWDCVKSRQDPSSRSSRTPHTAANLSPGQPLR